VHEALRDGNKDRARDLWAKIEALSKQVSCLWIRLRTELQEGELAEEFFRSMGAQYQKINSFYKEAVAIFPSHEKLPDIANARRDGLPWFFDKPELFSEALRAQRNYPADKAELEAAVEATVGRKGYLNEARRQEETICGEASPLSISWRLGYCGRIEEAISPTNGYRQAPRLVF
jgi:hypothetical protein